MSNATLIPTKDMISKVDIFLQDFAFTNHVIVDQYLIKRESAEKFRERLERRRERDAGKADLS